MSGSEPRSPALALIKPTAADAYSEHRLGAAEAWNDRSGKVTIPLA
ncbi:MAG: hypothetical protein H6710_19965 [Myxococcales bacterium]|nr:hypothetical protein [Myxococcales bacterium]